MYVHCITCPVLSFCQCECLKSRVKYFFVRKGCADAKKKILDVELQIPIVDYCTE